MVCRAKLSVPSGLISIVLQLSLACPQTDWKLHYPGPLLLTKWLLGGCSWLNSPIQCSKIINWACHKFEIRVAKLFSTMFCIVCVHVYIDSEGSPPKKQKSAKSSFVSTSNNYCSLIVAKHNKMGDCSGEYHIY